MTRSIPIRAGVVLLGLAALMLATRFHHFGSARFLPDASVAVFLLGGFYLARARWFTLLFAEAALIDQVAVWWGGASDWCITPAYAFLVPAYGAAWLAGLWTAKGGVVRMPAAFLGGVAAWFAISNAGFFLFSGYFDELSFIEYATRVSQYFAGYLATAAAYVLLAAALHALCAGAVRALRRA
jgi:hypothetical protein